LNEGILVGNVSFASAYSFSHDATAAAVGPAEPFLRARARNNGGSAAVTREFFFRIIVFNHAGGASRIASAVASDDFLKTSGRSVGLRFQTNHSDVAQQGSTISLSRNRSGVTGSFSQEALP